MGYTTNTASPAKLVAIKVAKILFVTILILFGLCVATGIFEVNSSDLGQVDVRWNWPWTPDSPFINWLWPWERDLIPEPSKTPYQL
jgi:hypothetical protein